MWTYIVRRLALMVVTVFGITIVTYGIMRLTPGDPTVKLDEKARRQSTNTRESLERYRGFYNLDKPALFNTSPASRRTRLARVLEDFDSTHEETRKGVGEKLKSIGAAGLEPAFERLARAIEDEAAGRERDRPPGSGSGATARPLPPMSEHVVHALPSLAAGLAAAPPATTDRAGWEAWWAAHRGELTPAAGTAAADRFIAGEITLDQLAASHGTLATPRLAGALDDASDPGQIDRLSRALGKINAKPTWILPPNVEPTSDEGRDKLATNQRAWSRWFDRNGNQFEDLSTLGYLGRTVSETQYGTWVGRLVQLDFGDSIHYTRPVLEVIGQRMSVTIQLALLSILIGYVIAIPLGIYSAVRPGSRADATITVGLFILYSLPSFWVGNLMILFLTGGSAFPFNFPYQSNMLGDPRIDWSTWLSQLVLPLTCYTYASVAYVSRQVRTGMMEVIRSDFIRTARAKGLAERTVVLKHALRNSLIPVLTIMANILPQLIGGSVIIEQIFGIDGLGKLAYESVEFRDYPVEMAIAFVTAVLTLVGILLADLSYALVDPRITYN